MAADFVLVMGPYEEGYDRSELTGHAKAITFMRATPRGKHLIFEGWRKQPDDQGPELTLDDAMAAGRACGW